MEYKETENYIVKTDGGLIYYIPKGLNNGDYQEYLY